MSVVFPTSLDTTATFPVDATLAAETLADEPHSRLHGDLGAAVLALEAKVGVTSSADTASLDYKINHATGAGVPPGSLLPFAGTTAPTGFLLCFGQQVSTTTYASLFAVLGTTYGSGGGTFGIPDLRGRIPVGLDNIGGTAASRVVGVTTIGGSGGIEKHPLATAELANHNHTVTVSVTGISGTVSGTTGAAGGHNHHVAYDVISYVQGGGLGPFAEIIESGYNNGDLYFTSYPHTGTNTGPPDHTHTFSGSFSGGATGTGSSGSTGSGTPHQNMQPYIAINYIIAT